MPIAAIPLAIGIAGAASAAGGVAGGIMQSNAVGNAAQQQMTAAQTAQQNMQNAIGKALPLQQTALTQAESNYAPYLQLGQNATSTLGSLMGFNPSTTGGVPTGTAPTSQLAGTPGQTTSVTAPGAVTPTVMPGQLPATGTAPSSTLATGTSTNPLTPTSLTQPFSQQFTAPTAEQAAATPGYQFALQQGENAVQSSAAAKGNLLSPGTMKSLNNYAQGMASTTYQQTYNNAMQQYQNNANLFYQNQQNMYNRLSGTAQLGATMAGNLSSLQTGTAGQMANTILGGQQAVNQQLTNAAAAGAAGSIGQGNIMGNMFSGLGNLPFQAMMMNQMFGNNQTPATTPADITIPGAPQYMPAPTSGSGVMGSVPGYTMPGVGSMSNLTVPPPQIPAQSYTGPMSPGYTYGTTTPSYFGGYG